MASTSISECVDWRGNVVADLDAPVADLLASLVRLNRELNGDMPSETQGAASIPREIVYAMAEIIRVLRRAIERPHETRSQVASDAAWTIETAWVAVLAGDIDDILDHVAEERRANRR